MSVEKQRLANHYSEKENWLRWGPYVSERQWATVREDYSANGDAWNYTNHETARSYTYRWGEEGIGGICDDKQDLCFALALWNKKDPLLKERFFGLKGPQGNHGEDVKELYYYLDNTPTHSYMKMLYKYPLQEYPYIKLYEENDRRGRNDEEYEILDTGIFDNDDYCDVFIEYAKKNVDSICVRVTISNRSNKTAQLNVVPQLWFRNTWQYRKNKFKPSLYVNETGDVAIKQKHMHNMLLHCIGEYEFLFCDNETNPAALHKPITEAGYYKDGIDEYLVHSKKEAVNPALTGTKVACNYDITVKAKKSKVIYLQLSNAEDLLHSAKEFEKLFGERIKEADEFYNEIQTGLEDEENRLIQRQAFAGMLWSKQFYYYDMYRWLEADDCKKEEQQKRSFQRNSDWRHLRNADIISMPDKWEYPWYAAWDLAFHCIPLSILDPNFAKQQLMLFTSNMYMHPNGQLPAYEWNFSDVNPPVHAWAVMRVFQIDTRYNNKPDYVFLETIFNKLLMNFTWWVNRKDSNNSNIFQGGFLGLDNIGIFDRNATIANGGYLEQSDGTGWMAMYCLNMLHISLELATHNKVFQDIATKFFDHFVFIADAMTHFDEENNLWDFEDEFFYDVIRQPNDKSVKLKVRSMVGLIPLLAVEVFDSRLLEENPVFFKNITGLFKRRPQLQELVLQWQQSGINGKHIVSLVWGDRLTSILKRMLDEKEFLSPYGIRALSKVYEEHPFSLNYHGVDYNIRYTPAESDSDMFGGNSNWRGPIWFPVNYLIIEALQRFHYYYGDDYKVEFPTGSGNLLSLDVIAEELGNRLVNIFRKDEAGNRPVYGGSHIQNQDPFFKNYILFYEYFHGDNGRGVGASHQTGWTGLVAKLLQPKGG